MVKKSCFTGRLDVKAFTLIELLVVVLIIGILAAVALPQYQKAVLKGRVMQVVPYLKAVKEAEEVYYLSNGEYTSDIDSLAVSGTCPPDWTCQLMADNNIPKVEAGYDSWKLAVVSSFDHRDDMPEWAGIMYCFARTGSPRYDQVCKSMGAPISNGVSSGGTRYYIGK